MLNLIHLRQSLIYGIPIAASLLLASCGSYQQASYYDDGIYSSGSDVVRVEKRNPEGVRSQEMESNRYGEYFGQKADQIGEILDSEVFTDIDGYSSQTHDSIPYGERTDYSAYDNNYSGNPGWGDNPTSLTINVYDSSWAWGAGYGFGGLYAGWNYPYWGYGWNAPYYGWGWGWHNPWRYNRWGWAGYYNPWYGSYGWGYPGYYSYWNRPYYSSRYYGRDYAFISGRRGYNDNYIGGSTLLGRSNRTATRGYSAERVRTNAQGGTLANRSSRSYSDGNASRRAISADARDRNTDYRSSRSTRYSPGATGTSRTSPNYGTQPSTRSGDSYNRSGSRQASPAYRSSGSRSSRSYQPSRSTAPRSSSYSRPSSSSRSSGTLQSSGSSSRSSGASRSSGSSRSGRGN